MAQSSGTQLEEAAIHAMLHTEFGIEARQFQVKVLCDMIFRSRRILMVRRTGDGKSVEPLGSLRASGGVGICVVPLLTIGCGQAAAATAACTSMEAVHWDDQPRDEKRLLLERLEATSDRSGCLALFVSPQFLDGKENSLRTTIKGLFERGAISTVAIDEMHRVSLDAAWFRPEFGRLYENLLSSIALSPATEPVALVAMTATLTVELLEKFREITRVDFDVEEWGDVSRRNIAMRLAFTDQTTKLLQKLAEKHRPDEGKVALYTNHSHRVKNSTREKSASCMGRVFGCVCCSSLHLPFFFGFSCLFGPILDTQGPLDKHNRTQSRLKHL